METMHAAEPSLTVMPASAGMNAQDFEIYTRPEIRKGCLWDIQLRFNPEFVKKHQISQIYVEKPRGSSETTTYLCLKIRSKLIKPIRELPFTKVAQTVTSEGDVLYFSDFSTVTLKVKFTARPRAVFHKHSDMMILLVSVKRGERVIATSEAELIFRGGTGSIHSAETRKAIPSSRDSSASLPSTNFPSYGLSSVPPATRNVSPRTQDPFKLSDTVISPKSESPPHSVLEFEDFDSHQFCNDFIQNKGDALMSFTSGGFSSQHTFDDLLNTDNDFSNGLWAEHLFNEFEAFQGTAPPTPLLQTKPTNTISNMLANSANSNMNATTMELKDVVEVKETACERQHTHPTSEAEFTLVFGKRRGACTNCVSECGFYKGSGGPCNECGCYPSAHLNLDEPRISRKRRRLSEVAEISETEDYEIASDDIRMRKRPKYLLEVKYFQKLFFSCLQYMTIPQISAVCSRAPVPIFVKDASFTYIYINSTFLTFIMDITQSQNGVLHQNVAQVLDRGDADAVIKQEQYLMEQEEGTIKTFDVPLRREIYRVMKQWTKLPDGQRVIIGVVVSNP